MRAEVPFEPPPSLMEDGSGRNGSAGCDAVSRPRRVHLTRSRSRAPRWTTAGVAAFPVDCRPIPLGRTTEKPRSRRDEFGPYALVLGGTVKGNARIEDQAVVVSGTVSSGTVGAMSIIGSTSWGVARR